MNRKYFCFIFLIPLLFSCASIKDEHIDLESTLNNAIVDASNNIIEKIPLYTKIAMVNTSVDYQELTNYVLREIAVSLVNHGNFEIVEREELDSINKEHNFQMSGVVNDSDVISIVEKYGAQSVVSCSISGSGNLCRLYIRTLDVRTGKVQALNSYSIKDTDIPTNKNTTGVAQCTLIVSSSSSGKLEITGSNKSIVVDFQPMSSQIFSEFQAGTYILTMTYPDGKTDRRPVTINASTAVEIEFKYQMPNLWLVSIGTNKYKNVDGGDLRFAISDARSINQSFKDQEGLLYNHVYNQLILDGTRNGILGALNSLYQANKNDIIVLYFSGHGYNDNSNNYLYFPSDTIRSNGIFSNCISINDILPVLNVTGTKIVIFDTDVNTKLISDLRKVEAIVFLPAIGGEYTLEAVELGHGLFTYILLNGLEGRADINNDGFINARELGDYVLKFDVKSIDISIEHAPQPLIYIPKEKENFILSRVKTITKQNM
ncbi:MAG: caspase family protein [Prevotellaceae bacterium]|jgi:hypothetical protein|nr:caspase family protein [Prevotellaceae bacterium]